jgi:hypothetical protein
MVMPTRGRYFFIVQGPSQAYDDDAGTWFWDAKSAFAHAKALINELKSEGGSDFRDWHMIVRDALGRTVFCIPFNPPSLAG